MFSHSALLQCLPASKIMQYDFYITCLLYTLYLYIIVFIALSILESIKYCRGSVSGGSRLPNQSQNTVEWLSNKNRGWGGNLRVALATVLLCCNHLVLGHGNPKAHFLRGSKLYLVLSDHLFCKSGLFFSLWNILRQVSIESSYILFYPKWFLILKIY